MGLYQKFLVMASQQAAAVAATPLPRCASGVDCYVQVLASEET